MSCSCFVSVIGPGNMPCFYLVLVGRPGLRRVLSWDPGFSDDDDYQSSITSGGSLNKLTVYGSESLFASGSSKLFKVLFCLSFCSFQF